MTGCRPNSRPNSAELLDRKPSRHSSREGLSSGRSSQTEEGSFWTFDQTNTTAGADPRTAYYPVRRFDSETKPWWAQDDDDAIAQDTASTTTATGVTSTETDPLRTDTVLPGDPNTTGRTESLDADTLRDNPAYVPRPSDSSAAVWWDLSENKFNDEAPAHAEQAPDVEPEVDPRFQAFPVRRNLSEPRAWWEEDTGEDTAAPAPAPPPALSPAPVKFRTANEMLGIYDDDDDETSSESRSAAAEDVDARLSRPVKCALPGPQESVSSSTETESSSSDSGSSVYQDVGSEESSGDEQGGSRSGDMRFSLSMVPAAGSDDDTGSSPTQSSSSAAAAASALAAAAAAADAVLASDFVFQPCQRDSGYGTADRDSTEALSFIGACQDIDALLPADGPAPGSFEEFEQAVASGEVPTSGAEEPASPGAAPSEEERLAAKRNLSLFISK